MINLGNGITIVKLTDNYKITYRSTISQCRLAGPTGISGVIPQGLRVQVPY